MKNIPFIKATILNYLYSKKELTGYDFMKFCSKQNIKISPGSVYPHLKKLENDGYIKYKKEGKKKVYTFTEEGLNYFKSLNISNELIDKTFNKVQFVINCNCENVNYEIKNNIKNLIKELSDLDWKKKNDILNFLDKINILEKSIIKFLNEGSNQI
ncbi:PadR family transcriptional regulator [Oceanotoga sp. DSM 15011]|jgi:DNA-binding PadR family transcriptional regulator|uniref:PadR family transcriptional regulator n=1 Tax=Oceanotoga teriensis TaxID=515440 RepID=A0AA45C4T5_9BACT|nr:MULTISPECIES: PadR family transcriptional regulator [Oceanotoga]MDN5343166.1 hypothetical protein [Oceanotoga sp.]MDO7977752.1 PadR family transcriptional regulator [Oceanotoga teriensis]PWJ87133.1 PadR family transcriptional regulator [Oceanotoga teriensis]UYP00751.1 PadR family transcriptional regulator [Oceanotoga sp. DSM 15011]